MGAVGAMPGSICTLPQRPLWRFAGHDIICSGHILCADHCRDIHPTQEKASCRETLQGLRLPLSAGVVYPYGIIVLYFADYVQAQLYMAGTDYSIDRYTYLLFGEKAWIDTG